MGAAALGLGAELVDAGVYEGAAGYAGVRALRRTGLTGTFAVGLTGST